MRETEDMIYVNHNDLRNTKIYEFLSIPKGEFPLGCIGEWKSKFVIDEDCLKTSGL